MSNLEKFSLARNELSVNIPVYLFNNTPYLNRINLGNNSLSGQIPQGVASPMLQFLSLQYNQLTGTAPPAVYNLSQLQVILLCSNNLAGPIPNNQTFNLPMLQSFIAITLWVGFHQGLLHANTYKRSLYLTTDLLMLCQHGWLNCHSLIFFTWVLIKLWALSQLFFPI
jgi:hypothetical protein